jgi:hypothetical protein
MIPQHVDWVRYLIETEGFAIRDFLLTAPRVRPPKRERRRRQIMQLMYRCGISAHDLVSELPIVAGADGGRSSSHAPK